MKRLIHTAVLAAALETVYSYGTIFADEVML